MGTDCDRRESPEGSHTSAAALVRYDNVSFGLLDTLKGTAGAVPF